MRSAAFALAGLAVALGGCSAPREQAAKPPAKPKITQFYASRLEIGRGDTVLVCYGTANATSVKIDPPLEGVSPSPNRCVQAAPERDTTFTLTASGPGGEAIAQVSVRVGAQRAKAPEPAAQPSEAIISTFIATASEVDEGQLVSLCYDAAGAESLRLQPPVVPVTPGKKCVMVRPHQTTTYSLEARSGGRTETQRLTVRVRPGDR